MRLILIVMLCALGLPGISQFYDASTSLVLSAEAAIPSGPLSKTNSFGAGGSAKVRIPSGIRSDVFITANLAAFPGKNYTVGNTKKKAALAKAASVFVGYRIYLNPLSDYNSFYIQGDAGVSAVTTKLINPAIAPSIGFLINDKLDLSLKYQKILSNNKYADYSFIALGIGYGFNFN